MGNSVGFFVGLLFELGVFHRLSHGELLGLEIKDLLDDCTTIRIVQQTKGTKLTPELKTANSARLVDLSPEVAVLLREFLGGRTSGSVFANRLRKPLNPSNIRNRVIHPLLEEKDLTFGGTHIFRRFQMTWLCENSVPSDIERFWLGHANQSLGDDYSMLKGTSASTNEWRRKSASALSYPTRAPSVVPIVPKTTPHKEQQVVVQVRTVLEIKGVARAAHVDRASALSVEGQRLENRSAPGDGSVRSCHRVCAGQSGSMDQEWTRTPRHRIIGEQLAEFPKKAKFGINFNLWAAVCHLPF
jgi:integrase-like protein